MASGFPPRMSLYFSLFFIFLKWVVFRVISWVPFSIPTQNVPFCYDKYYLFPRKMWLFHPFLYGFCTLFSRKSPIDCYEGLSRWEGLSLPFFFYRRCIIFLSVVFFVLPICFFWALLISLKEVAQPPVISIFKYPLSRYVWMLSSSL